MKQQIDELMTKEMDRKTFLKYMGSIVLTVIGVSGLMKTILHNGHVRTEGYGASSYGNKKL